jgi:type I restriction enzyme, S subunit
MTMSDESIGLPEGWEWTTAIEVCFKVIDCHNKCLLNLYLLYALQSPLIKAFADKVSAGSGVKHLRVKDVESLPIPLPPIAEQKRIVAKIEELRSRTQKAREALEVIPQMCDRFRQSVLAAAFRGDLTADWREENPDVEPAQALLERSWKERRIEWEAAELAKLRALGKIGKSDKWKLRYKGFEIIDESASLELPNSWIQTTIGSVSECLDSSRIPINKEERQKRQGAIPTMELMDKLDGSMNIYSMSR